MPNPEESSYEARYSGDAIVALFGGSIAHQEPFRLAGTK
jgi:hypothetical protein